MEAFKRRRATELKNGSEDSEGFIAKMTEKNTILSQVKATLEFRFSFRIIFDNNIICSILNYRIRFSITYYVFICII